LGLRRISAKARKDMTERVKVKRGTSLNQDARLAVRELAEQLDQPGLSAVFFFCSSLFDLPVLAEEIAGAFTCPVVGCTSSGEITPEGYTQHAITGASLSSAEFAMHPQLIQSLESFSIPEGRRLAEDVQRQLRLVSGLQPAHTFGLLLIDGMSMLEEQVAATLYNSFDQIPLIGGSAGDDLVFKSTYVYFNGAFHDHAAVFAVCETTLPFTVFKTQHFEPSGARMVITEADSPRRVVTEINGIPAAEEYARVVGMELDELTPTVFSANPVMLRIGGEYYVRAIQKVNPDHSMSFYCAIDNGLVLTLGQGVDLVRNLDEQLSKLSAEVPNIQLIIGCDCILRRLEIFDKQIQQQVQETLAKHNFIGFSTYGEQYNAIHVNQTLTGVAIGG
jgi:hypothetical protein